MEGCFDCIRELGIIEGSQRSIHAVFNQFFRRVLLVIYRDYRNAASIRFDGNDAKTFARRRKHKDP